MSISTSTKIIQSSSSPSSYAHVMTHIQPLSNKQKLAILEFGEVYEHVKPYESVTCDDCGKQELSLWFANDTHSICLPCLAQLVNEIQTHLKAQNMPTFRLLARINKQILMYTRNKILDRPTVDPAMAFGQLPTHEHD